MYNKFKKLYKGGINMIGINEEKFKESVNIRFNNINQGFSKFKYKNLEKNNAQGDFVGFILECFKINKNENSYVDFYYHSLIEEDKRAFKSLLDNEEKIFFEDNVNSLNKNTIYFKLTEKFIEFLVNISLREILFSTFYFTKIPCTIWSNYNEIFIIFFQNEEHIIIYEKLAKKYNLDIK